MSYSYEELVKLENEAIQRARKISEHERDAVREMNRSMNGANEPARHSPPPPKPEQRKKENPQKTRGELPEDSLLILALLLILSHEKADTLLIMALMYILL